MFPALERPCTASGKRMPSALSEVNKLDREDKSQLGRFL